MWWWICGHDVAAAHSHTQEYVYYKDPTVNLAPVVQKVDSTVSIG